MDSVRVVFIFPFIGYPDTHRHRLGVNYHQIPINRPLSGVRNYQRDGFMSGKTLFPPLPQKDTHLLTPFE
jgi:catalase